MPSVIQQTLIGHLARAQVLTGSHPALAQAVLDIQALPSERRLFDRSLLRDAAHHDRTAIGITARAHYRAGPYSWSNLASKLVYEHNIQKSVPLKLDPKKGIGPLRDYILTVSHPFDAALLNYCVTWPIQEAARGMEGFARGRMLLAGALFTYGAVKCFIGEANRRPKDAEIPRETAYEAAADVVVDNLQLLDDADEALARNKDLVSPLSSPLLLLHYLALRALKASEEIHERAMNERPESATRMAEIGAKRMTITNRITPRSESQLQIKKQSFQDELDKIFNPPPPRFRIGG